jgi:hypothetical protein
MNGSTFHILLQHRPCMIHDKTGWFEYRYTTLIYNSIKTDKITHSLYKQTPKESNGRLSFLSLKLEIARTNLGVADPTATGCMIRSTS